ncbi:unnamed protein product [Rhodiola kirilowii]
MQEELEEFARNDVWDLVPRPDGVNVIGTKWIFKNKSDTSGNITRNKARLVAQGYSQIEGIDFDETFAPCCTLGSHSSAPCSGLSLEVSTVPDGCQKCFPERIPE